MLFLSLLIQVSKRINRLYWSKSHWLTHSLTQIKSYSVSQLSYSHFTHSFKSRIHQKHIVIDSELFRSFYERGASYNTRYISVANFAFYALCNIYGHVYVNVSNVNCTRANMLHSSYPNFRDFYCTVLLTPFYFLAGNIVTLKSPSDQLSNANEPKLLSSTDCLWSNMAFWFSGFFIGLNYTHAN